jgi:glycosyltransferase involved in cell wall biosynthesis
MKVLMIAPQPFFEPRGTPISVLQRLRGLAALGYQVDLATYHIGEDVMIPHVTIIRAPRIPFIHRVKIGPSWAKIPLDIMLFLQSFWLLLTRRYDAIHSHEEAAFLAMPLSWLFRTPHLYDMHSSLPKQLASFNFGNYRPLVRLMAILESWTLKTCDVVLTVGLDLEDYVLQLNPQVNHMRIENIAVQNEMIGDLEAVTSLRHKLGLAGRLVVVYTGTFEAYQGLDLLLASMEVVVQQEPDIILVLVGGKPEQVAYWQQEVDYLGLSDHVTFVGTVPLHESSHYLGLADILVSPRTEGPSVPLKIYSYLQAGKATVATNIMAHTQVLDDTTAVLVEPTPNAFAKGLLHLLVNPELRQTLGQNARAYAEKEFSQAIFLNKLEHAYLSIKYQKKISDIQQPARGIQSTATANS